VFRCLTHLAKAALDDDREKMLNLAVKEVDSVNERTGGQLLVDCLLAHGVDTVFCVPGESFLTVLDALRDVQNSIRIIVGRHEASVANMAEAYGKLTGKPGVCFVTRGPGASHAAIAVHTAFQDSTPLILFVGQVTRDQLGREAFQEMDYHHLFGNTAKWVAEIVDAERVPELIGRAFHMAVNGRPGPVVISIPEDMQNDMCAGGKPAHYKHASAAPSAAALTELQSMIESAKRPLLILGGGGWTAEATVEIRRFAETFQLPAIAGFRRQDLFDNTHPNYVGVLGLGTNPALVEMVHRSDLLVVIGERLGDMTTASYSLLKIPRPVQQLIHVHGGAEELGILYEADLLINSTARDFAKAVGGLKPNIPPDRSDWISSGRKNYESFSTPPLTNHPTIDVARIVRDLSDRLPSNAIITNGAGLYTAYVHRFYQFRDFGSQLAPTSGAMGYGFPAALAAKVVHPDRPAVCFAGDGCFLMASQELATAVMYRLPIILIVIDNSCYGSIRFHQEKYFPGRVVATDLLSPDFVALAKSYGAYAERVEATEDFAAAFDRATASGRPALLTFRQDVLEVIGSVTRRPEAIE
jgi:acetolactate synthase-1/2/3 large subunit